MVTTMVRWYCKLAQGSGPSHPRRRYDAVIVVAFPLRIGHALIVFIHKKLKELILERDLYPQEAV